MKLNRKLTKQEQAHKDFLKREYDRKNKVMLHVTFIIAFVIASSVVSFLENLSSITKYGVIGILGAIFLFLIIFVLIHILIPVFFVDTLELFYPAQLKYYEVITGERFGEMMIMEWELEHMDK